MSDLAAPDVLPARLEHAGRLFRSGALPAVRGGLAHLLRDDLARGLGDERRNVVRHDVTTRDRVDEQQNLHGLNVRRQPALLKEES